MSKFRFRTVRNTFLFMMLLLPLLGSMPAPRGGSDIPDISARINEFTVDLLKHSAQSTNAPDNTVLSAQSIFQGMAMSYIASGGETRKELAEVLHFPDDNDKLIEELSSLRQQVQADALHAKMDVSIASSLWLDGTYADFRKDYIGIVQNAFAASLHTVEFNQRDQVSAAINKWVSENTHGKIQKCVTPQDFNSKSSPGIINEPALVMVNAAYINADWASRFETDGTRAGAFHVDADTTEDTLMMNQRAVLPYSENEHVQFLELPYTENIYSMYLVLPKSNVSIGKLMDVVTTDMLVALKRSAFNYEVDVLLPKFQMESHLGVKDTLVAMGVKVSFDSARADFDTMINKKVEAFSVYINEIYHDACIEVHEEGTEAAAATTAAHFSFGCSAPLQPPRVDFHVDHPFLFLIVDNRSYSILFSGWISRPHEIGQEGRPADQ